MGIRTPDLLIANETLYQLSYTPNLINFRKLHGDLRSKKDACLYRHKPMKANSVTKRNNCRLLEALRMSFV